MHEYVTVSSSSYDPASLATKLTEKAAEGWMREGCRRSTITSSNDGQALILAQAPSDTQEDKSVTIFGP